MSSNKLSEKTLEKIENYSEKCLQNCVIEQGLYIEHKVNRGLRDLNGKGVLTGLTEISDVNSLLHPIYFSQSYLKKILYIYVRLYILGLMCSNGNRFYRKFLFKYNVR